MSDRVWVKHPETGATKEVAASAVRVLRRGGWQELDDAEVAALVEQQQADRAERLAALTPASAAPETPAPAPVKAPAPVAKSETAPSPAAKSEKQES